MAKKRTRQDGQGPLELIEEVFHLLRRAPANVLALYYIGAMPFVIGLLYFWADMARSGLAYSTLPRGALALTALFIWMKAWQTAFGRGLWALVSGEPVPVLTASRMLRVAARQTMVQPSGLFILPIALLTALPFPRVYAFYQGLCVLDNGDEDLPSLLRRSSELSRLWPRQNLILIWALSPYLMMVVAALYLVIMPVAAAAAPDWTSSLLYVYSAVFTLAALPLSPFGVAVAVNIATALLSAPMLLKTLFGVQTVFAGNPELMMNSIFFAVVCGLSYLCLDPLIKAAYVLRCFHGDSLRTGADLKVQLRRFMVKATLVVIMLGSLLWSGAAMARPAQRTHKENTGKTPAAKAPEPAASVSEEARPAPLPPRLSVSPQKLDRALDRVLQGRKYAWRMPRPKRDEAEEGIVSAFLRGIFETIGGWIKEFLHWLEKFYRWLRNLFPKIEPREKPSSGLADLGLILRVLLYALLAAALAIGGVMLYRIYRRRGASAVVVAAQALFAKPDLEDESVTADELPEDKWIAYARELAGRGELRLALRAVFLASLAALGQHKLILIAPFKSNRDYGRELLRRAHAEPGLPGVFDDSVAAFESVWYGMHETTRELLDRVIANQQRLKASGRQQ
ncbi:MAG TPA: DUF4129 domain-containing protein [bacterium]|nr:DUF4129 domain-containing protein [bacterium]